MNIFDHCQTEKMPEVWRKFRYGHVLDLPDVKKLYVVGDVVSVSGGPLFTEGRWDDSDYATMFSVWIVVGPQWDRAKIPKDFPHQVHIWCREARIVDL
jgi:hypothetical protein